MTERKIKQMEISFEPETSQNWQTKFANEPQAKLCSKTLPFFSMGDNFKYRNPWGDGFQWPALACVYH